MKRWHRPRIVLRAYRVSLHRRRLMNQEHIAWARELLGDKNHGLPLHYGAARGKVTQRNWGTPPPGWSYDPHDGFPYPPT